MKKNIKVSDLIKLIHDYAPPRLAMDWDNVGFLLGDPTQKVKKILLALDVTPDTLEYALQVGANLIISHHPLIFRPIKKITSPLYLNLIKNDIAVISAHTNLDITPGGVNHRLADLFQLKDLEILSPTAGAELYHVAVYVPESGIDLLKAAMFKAGAGYIGNYSHCADSYHVHGQFMPLIGSKPTFGSPNRLQSITEIKLEVFCSAINLDAVIKAINSSHPYETPVYAVYPQKQSNPDVGLGLIGNLTVPITIKSFAQNVKEVLHAPALKVWLADKKSDHLLHKIALCGGAAYRMISSVGFKADLFLAGEFDYHSMLDSPIPLIEAGHFHTEFPVLQVLNKLIAPLDIPTDILPLNLHETTTKILYL